MGNPYTGEVALILDGQRHVLRLSLGALAELEATMREDGLVPMIERFEAGRFGTRDVIAVLIAGLRGGGWNGAAADVVNGEIEGGPVEATRVAAELLGRAFALPAATP